MPRLPYHANTDGGSAASPAAAGEAPALSEDVGDVADPVAVPQAVASSSQEHVVVDERLGAESVQQSLIGKRLRERRVGEQCRPAEPVQPARCPSALSAK